VKFLGSELFKQEPLEIDDTSSTALVVRAIDRYLGDHPYLEYARATDNSTR
jgi:hypothetical protein